MRKQLSIGTKSVLVILVFFLGGKQIYAATFSDVPSTNPYYAPIESLKNLGVVKGYGDGTFKPGQTVNRAEALKMVLLTAGVKVSPGLYQTDFPDVKLGDWFSGYVFYGQASKIVNGNPDGTFAPDRQVNKAEFLKMGEQAFLVDLTSYKTVQFALSRDIVNVSGWFVPYFNYAKSVGIIAPDISNNLEPSRFLTRGECAEILYKMYILKNGGEVQQLLSTAEAKLVDALIQVNAGNTNEALIRSQEAVFYADNALQKNPASNVTQGASLIAHGFQKLFEAYGAAMQNDKTGLKSLAEEAKQNADQAMAKDVSLQNLSQQLKDLAANLEKSAGV